MGDMVTLVAKSIYESRNGAGCKPWSLQTKAHKEPYLNDARAAISAMREPTEAMWLAEGLVDHMHPTDAWEIMIDAALNPSQT